jgi:hypothetical protein
MKRSILTAVVVLSVFSLVASASAGQKNRDRDQHNSNNGNFQKYAQNRSLNLQSDGGISNIVSHFKKKCRKHDDNPKPLDPGRGDDRVPVAPVTPQGPPGFVWVNGHWERERATKTPTMIVDPIRGSAGPIVRDHRTTSPTVRDHRTISAIVRDHRNISPTVRDHRTISVPVVRDHRTIVVPTVRDHRTISTPVVRDHRTTSGPVVRDHRNGSTQGGVSVATDPNSIRNSGIPTLRGPSPLDMLGSGMSKIASALGKLF